MTDKTDSIHRADILARSDRGVPVADIAEAVGMTIGRVYALLRVYRPKRKRKPRECTSELRGKILALNAKEIPPARIVEVLGTSRQYVHRILGEL